MGTSTRRKRLRPSRVTVETRRLRTHWGWCYPETGQVVLDARLTGRRHLDTLVHELVHVAFPDLSETGTNEVTRLLVTHLWKQQYRRLDTSADGC